MLGVYYKRKLNKTFISEFCPYVARSWNVNYIQACMFVWLNVLSLLHCFHFSFYHLHSCLHALFPSLLFLLCPHSHTDIWNQNIRAEKVREYIWKSILHISPVARKNFLAVSATSAFFLDAKHSLWKEAKAIVHKIPYKKYSSRQLHWKFYLFPPGRSKLRQMGVTFIGDN